MAGLAHAMAIESPKVTADVIEVQEFRDVAAFYNVMGVPKTVINDRIVFTGAVPEEVFVKHILRAVGAEEAEEEEFEPVSDQTTPIGLGY